MFSATIIGRPMRLSSSTRRRFRRRLVASTTQISRSGAGSRGMPAQHDVARDRFIQGRGFQAVGARQVHHPVDAPAVRADEAAFLALDGHARVVRDLLAAAGQAVEQRGLAAIGHADQGQVGGSRRYCRRGRRHEGGRGRGGARSCRAAVAASGSAGTGAGELMARPAGRAPPRPIRPPGGAERRSCCQCERRRDRGPGEPQRGSETPRR